MTKLPSIYCRANVKKLYWLSFLLLLSFVSCQENCDKDIDLSQSKVDVKIVRTEKEMFDFKSPAEVHSFLTRHPSFANLYFKKAVFPHDSLLENFLYNFYSNKELRYLYHSADSTFGDLKELHASLDNLFSHIRYYYPKYFVPEIYTLVSGFQFENDILISDSLVAISLDYFLGRKAKYRPPLYNYFLERYEKQYIVPMLSLAISGKFNRFDDKDETMLASMIYYGKAYYFSQKMLPCTPDSLIVQYSGKQLEDIHKNEELIWGHFIEHKLLFETKPQTIEKYVGESPRVNEIGEKCPGRIGRWLGWEIVKKYAAEHPELSLQQLMEEKDAQKIFRLAKYKPAAK
jgi:gliding motility-associated lipoprotein GldB